MPFCFPIWMKCPKTFGLSAHIGSLKERFNASISVPKPETSQDVLVGKGSITTLPIQLEHIGFLIYQEGGQTQQEQEEHRFCKEIFTLCLE